MGVEVKFDDINVILAKRGLEAKGAVQKFIDSEVLRYCDPYIPFRSGILRKSGTLGTVIGTGLVKWSTPYARRQYYENKGNGKRGKLWFERMKVNHKNSIIKGAAEIAGGKT